MSICSTHSSTSAPELDRLGERVQVDDDEVERRDAELVERGDVLGLAGVGEQPGVHPRVQGLDPAVENLRESGDLLHGGDRNAARQQWFSLWNRWRRCRRPRHATLAPALQPGLIVDADQRAPDRPARVRSGHPMVAFRPFQVTPRVATRPITSASSRRSTTLIRSCRVASSSSSSTGTDRLRQDRSGVRPGVDEMHRAAGDLDAVVQRGAHSMRAGESGQQRGVGVDDSAREITKETAGQGFS